MKEDEEEEGKSSDKARDFEAGDGVIRLGLVDKLDTGAVGHGVTASHSEEEEDSLADTEPMPTDEDLTSDINAPQSSRKSPGRSSNEVDLAPSPIASTTQETEDASETGDEQMLAKVPEVESSPPQVTTPAVNMEMAVPAPTVPSMVEQQMRAFMASDQCRKMWESWLATAPPLHQVRV